MHKNKPVNFAPAKQQKMRKRTRKSPKKAKLGAFWVLEGMGTVVGRCERMGKPGNRAEGLVSPAGSGAAPRWGASSTDRGGSRDRFAAERHWRSLTPRHAVLEWMWESTPGSGEGAVLPSPFGRAPKKSCCSGAAGIILELECFRKDERKLHRPVFFFSHLS